MDLERHDFRAMNYYGYLRDLGGLQTSTQLNSVLEIKARCLQQFSTGLLSFAREKHHCPMESALDVRDDSDI